MEKKIIFNTDLSELEARALAALGNIPTTRCSEYLDLHTITAAVTCGVMYSEVTRAQRKAAKSLNFSLLYTPGARWNPPPKEELMRIWTKDQQMQIADDIGWTRGDLYDSIKSFFDVFNEKRK